MRTKKFLYPVDTDQFQDIRERGLVYVDKTDMMYELANEYKYVFLARPRRFGKSLLCNTFKAYFQGQKELFEGLKVMELEKKWKTYPVLHFIMSGLKNVTIPLAQSKLENFIYEYECIYGSNPEYKTPGARFRSLIRNAANKTKEKVVILIDEYDSPIMRLMYDEEQLEAMRSMLREFYQVLKDEGDYIRFVFMTGVTKFSQLSIFSELNNLKQISMMDEYSGVCGITQE
ncbi:MAG: AAA family ATPase [Alistipes sp.]|nr:AAA family ATPase [Candidatus Alistipes equi]